MAARTITYFLLTSFCSALIGLSLVIVVRPGASGSEMEASVYETSIKKPGTRPMDAFMDLIRNLFPDNLFMACFKQATTVRTTHTGPVTRRDSNGTAYTVMETITLSELKMRPGTNTLGLICFCVIFGAVLSGMPKEGAVMIRFFKIAEAVIMKLVLLCLWLTPIGVASLICEKLVRTDDISNLISRMGTFILTVLTALCIHQFIFIQLIYFAFLRKNPFRFWFKMLQASLTAFSVCSSSATLPATIHCTEIKAGLDSRVTKFVLPLGATINMNGTACFVTIASIFIAQMHDVHVGAGQALMACLTATAVGVASATVPSAALFLLFIVLSVVGAEQYAADISLLFAIDWFLDRCRTVNNILGDAYAAAVLQHLSRRELEAMDEITAAYRDGSK